MKKSRIAALMLAAVLSMGAVSAPAETGGIGITVSAASVLSAPKNITSSCSKGTLTVKWSNVPGAEAYRISVLYPGETKYKSIKTVYSTNATIPSLSNGTTVSVKITPLKKSGNKFIEGKSATFSKLIKCESAYMDGKLFVFDTTLLGKSASQVEKALGKEIKLVDWEYWNDVNGDPVKFAWVEWKDFGISMIFNKNKKLIEVWSELPVDEYGDELTAKAESYYGDRDDIKAYHNLDCLFYDRYYPVNSSVWFDINDNSYYSGEEVITVTRQDYCLHKEIYGE